MDDRELERLEREADEALYRVDPSFAQELGYIPPPQPTPGHVSLHEALMMQRSHSIQQPHLAQTQQYQGGLSGSMGGAGLVGGVGLGLPGIFGAKK